MGKRRRSRNAVTVCLAIALAASALAASAQDPFEEPRRLMVDQQLRRRGIHQRELLQAMEVVPRHLFVPERIRPEAYVDEPLPLGASGEALLQPYMTARMIELLELDGSQKVLEIGTGTGYDAAVLSELAREVYTIEISEERGEQARSRLRQLGYANVQVRIGDGNQGWPEHAPFDAILLTAAPEEVPPKLIEQLRVDGRMVVAVGGSRGIQQLALLVKTADGVQRRKIEPVRISPMSNERQ